MPTDADATADRLAEIAAQLVGRIRDEQPAAAWRWLQLELPDPADWFALNFVLAAAVPVDATWLDLTAWRSEDRRRKERERKAAYRERRRQREVAA